MTTLVAYEVEEMTVEDLRRATDEALEAAGLTEAELREQAAARDFESLEARLAWVLVTALDAQ